MIIGMSMGQETCRILEQVSLNLLHWKKNLLTDICGTGGENLGTVTDTQSWCKIWPLNGVDHTRVKLKLLSRRKEVYESFSSRRKTRKSSKLSIPWNLAKPVKICPGIIVRQHLTVQKQMVLLRESYAGLKKGLLLYCCNQVWMKNGGRIPLNVTAICEKFTTSYQTGKHPTNGDLENHSRHPISAKDQPRLRQFGKRVLLGIFLGYAFFAVGIWTGDVVGRRH